MQALPLSMFRRLRFGLEQLLQRPLDWEARRRTDRNTLMYESAQPLARLYEPLIAVNDTFVLQEYFVPASAFRAWLRAANEVIGAGAALKWRTTTLLNITVRFVRQDTTTALPYAHTDVYAFVLYYRIQRTAEGDAELQDIHSKLANITLAQKGRFYL